MLMFENGLLASFIPELIMVLAYLICFVAPGFKHEKQKTNCAPKVIQTSAVQSKVISAYQVTKLDYGADNHIVESLNAFSVFPIPAKHTIFINLGFFPSDGLNQIHFSRPPPTI